MKKIVLTLSLLLLFSCWESLVEEENNISEEINIPIEKTLTETPANPDIIKIPVDTGPDL